MIAFYNPKNGLDICNNLCCGVIKVFVCHNPHKPKRNSKPWATESPRTEVIENLRKAELLIVLLVVVVLLRMKRTAAPGDWTSNSHEASQTICWSSAKFEETILASLTFKNVSPHTRYWTSPRVSVRRVSEGGASACHHRARC